MTSPRMLDAWVKQTIRVRSDSRATRSSVSSRRVSRVPASQVCARGRYWPRGRRRLRRSRLRGGIARQCSEPVSISGCSSRLPRPVQPGRGRWPAPSGRRCSGEPGPAVQMPSPIPGKSRQAAQASAACTRPRDRRRGPAVRNRPHCRGAPRRRRAPGTGLGPSRRAAVRPMRIGCRSWGHRKLANGGDDINCADHGPAAV